MGFAILLTSAHRVEGLSSFLNFIFFLEARDRYEAAVQLKEGSALYFFF